MIRFDQVFPTPVGVFLSHEGYISIVGGLPHACGGVSVAKHLFEKKDYSYALFFGHLAVEKIIKAIFVKNTDQQPPRSHNLLRLAKEACIELADVHQHDLIRITAFNLESRYPDYKKEFRKKCTLQFTETEL